MFHNPRERSLAIGIWISSYSVGGAIGPLLGGLLLAHFWWGSVFLLSVPVMLLLLIVAPILLPEYRDPKAGRMDLLSAAESLIGVLAIVYGIKTMAEDGWGWSSAAAIGFGLGMGTLFIRRQRRLSDPLIDLHLFRSPGFTLSLTIYMAATMIVFGPFVFIAQYLQLVLNFSPLRAALWILPSMVGFVIGSVLCPLLARRIKAESLIAGGLVLGAVGFVLVSLVDGSAPPVLLSVGLGLYSLGLSPAFTLTTDLIVGSARPERAGAAAAISETGSELGGALGIAVLGSIGLALYRRQMAGVPLAGLDPAAVHAARDTLGGATAVAAQLPIAEATSLLHTAQHIFTQGLHQVASLSAFAAFVMALCLGYHRFIVRSHIKLP
jgi:DHA2 family multidrug resistance protein-like MFS transporter